MSYPIGSAMADRAFESARDRAADAHFAPPLPVCPWCWIEQSNDDEEYCEECGGTMDGSDYFQCPYCGEIHPDDTVMCCKEMHVQKLSLPKCPECGSIDIYDYHHEAD